MEEQALCRVYRLGQKRNVTTIRYRMLNSFEEVLFLLMQILRLLLTCFIECCQDSGPEEGPSKFNVFKCKTIRDRRWGRPTSVSTCCVEMNKDLFISYRYSICLATIIKLIQQEFSNVYGYTTIKGGLLLRGSELVLVDVL
jgi:hypothetical protein